MLLFENHKIGDVRYTRFGPFVFEAIQDQWALSLFGWIFANGMNR